MKLVKTASGKKTIKMSKKEWTDLGKQAGWLKEAQNLNPQLMKALITMEEIETKWAGGVLNPLRGGDLEERALNLLKEMGHLAVEVKTRLDNQQ